MTGAGRDPGEETGERVFRLILDVCVDGDGGRVGQTLDSLVCKS